MLIIAGLLLLIFLAIAVVHGMWGFRIWWPKGDEQELARTVVGRRGIKRMPPPVQCFSVSVVMVGASVLVTVFVGVWALSIFPDWLIEWAMIALAVIFALRGFVGFTGFWARLFPEQPFRRLDLRYFSPLCLLLAAGILALIA